MGKLNGIAAFVGSITKGVGPYFSAFIYTYTSLEGPWYPFDYHFIFYLIVIAYIAQIILSHRVPQKLESKYNEPLSDPLVSN